MNEIKSEQAECLLNSAKQSNINGCPVPLGVAARAVILAEQEAEEHHVKEMKELTYLAIEAFYYSCNASDGKGGCRQKDDDEKCRMSCKKAKLFTQKLTEKQ